MKLETVADRRLHPATLVGRALRILPQTAFGLPAAVSFTSDVPLAQLLTVAAVGVGLAGVLALLGWMRFRYGVGAGEIVIESGVLSRKRRVIPFDRIQDIDIEQGLLARMFGTARVKIETGGAGKNEGALDSVSLAEAHRLRELLRRGQGQAADQALEGAAPAPAEAEPLLFAMDLPRVLLAGLFNFSLFYIAFVFGGFQYLEPLFDYNLVDPDRWIGPATAIAAGATWLASLFAAAVVIVVSAAIGIARTVAADYRFRLTRTATGLRRRRGLFTLSEVVIPIRRVQLSLIKAGVVARAFGWFRLEFQTLSADAARSGHQVAVPFGRMDELLPVLRQVTPAPLPPDEDYVRVSKRHILRQSLRWATVLALPIVAASFAWPLALALLGLLPLVVGAAALQWRHHRYCLTDTMLHVRQGFLTRRLWILPYDRIQTVGVMRGSLQRRLGLASVAVDTAGASAFHAPNIVNLPAADADALAERLLRAHNDARTALRLLRSPG